MAGSTKLKEIRSLYQPVSKSWPTIMSTSGTSKPRNGKLLAFKTCGSRNCKQAWGSSLLPQEPVSQLSLPPPRDGAITVTIARPAYIRETRHLASGRALVPPTPERLGLWLSAALEEPRTTAPKMTRAWVDNQPGTNDPSSLPIFSTMQIFGRHVRIMTSLWTEPSLEKVA